MRHGSAAVHFAIPRAGEVHPLCGEWGDARNWTKFVGGVTCPQCVARMTERMVPGAPSAARLATVARK